MPDASSYFMAAAIRDRRARRRRKPRRVRVWLEEVGTPDFPGGWCAELSSGLSTWGGVTQREAIDALTRLIEYRESVVEK